MITVVYAEGLCICQRIFVFALWAFYPISWKELLRQEVFVMDFIDAGEVARETLYFVISNRVASVGCSQTVSLCCLQIELISRTTGNEKTDNLQRKIGWDVRPHILAFGFHSFVN